MKNLKLEWQENPPSSPMTWDEANEYAKSLGDGYRLPTKEELIESYNNEIKRFKSSFYWSSSTYDPRTNYAWYVYFSSGYMEYYGSKSNSYYVHCVKIDKKIISDNDVNNDDDIIRDIEYNDMLEFDKLITNYYKLYHKYKETKHSRKIIELKNLINSSIKTHKEAKEKCEDYLNGNF